MIKDRETLKLYLDADKFALGITKKFPSITDSVWIYERTLRFYEYHKNTHHMFLRVLYAWLLKRRGERLGFSISGNVFGPGLRINHYGLLVVNSKAKVGKWCDIHQGVNIGENGCFDKDGTFISEVPQIGDYVFIGPGSKIFGAISIGNNVRIGANAVINKDVKEDSTAYGNPMCTKENMRNIITIAKTDTEELFLKQYPQYRGMI